MNSHTSHPFPLSGIHTQRRTAPGRPTPRPRVAECAETGVRRFTGLWDHAVMVRPLEPLVVRHPLRLPAPRGAARQGGVAAREHLTASWRPSFRIPSRNVRAVRPRAKGA
ncbi:hypothetical protein GCM10022284_12190 [Streptomyces hundungensis]